VTHDLRRERVIGYFAVAFAFLQIVFGAIVRITESGMGCGDDWPRCEGRFFPPLDRPDLIIEVMHRYLAVGVSLTIVAVLVAAILRKRAGGPNLLRPAVLALGLVVAAALLGAVTVKMTLAAPVVVVHKVIALALLVTLAWFTMRAGGFGASTMSRVSVTGRTARGAFAVAAITLAVVVLGAFTANVTGAAGSCIGFPHCRQIVIGGIPLTLNLAHRILAFALLGHVIGMLIGMRRRGEHAVVRRAGTAVLVLIAAQLLIAGAMVEMQFPAVVRSLHQAVGSAIWLSAFVFAALARLARRAENVGTAAVAPERPVEQPA
jgi:heme a synthase